MARFTRNRGSKHLRLRGRAGRFKKATLANTFGLNAPVCPHCRRFNPYSVGEPMPTECHNCGELVAEEEWK